MPAASMAFASLFALIGLVVLAAVGEFGISPMALPFAGGFMLVGPAVKRRSRDVNMAIGADCTRCGLCVDLCPTDSLKFEYRLAGTGK